MVAVFAPTDEEIYLYALLTDPAGIDLAEFAWVDESKDDKCFRLWDFQWPWYRDESQYQIDQASRTLGKALALDTPVPTPTGWTTMGELVVGDEVIDESGRSCRVTSAYDTRLDRPCYRVEFDDGTFIVADADHQWLTYTKYERTTGREPRVRTTAEIAVTARVQREANHSIPVAGALDLPEADLLIGPYTLGAWLGDGSSYRAHLTVGDDGHDVLREIEREGYLVKKLTTRFAYAIAYPHEVNHKTGTVSAHLRRIGVLENKHIPREYLRASRSQRIALLQGLMDTDGHCTKAEGRCEITLKSERLARDLYELVASLGQKPYFQKRTARCGDFTGPVYRVGFAPREFQPFRMAAKVSRVRPLRQERRVSQRRIVSVTPVVSVPVRCIAVDSPSRLFLAGEAMIPTHNSEGIAMRACSHPFVFPGQERLITAPELNHLRPVVDNIEKRIKSIWFLREMAPKDRYMGISRQPQWQIRFLNGAEVRSRLPQITGVGVKGQHPVVIELDEGQDFPEPGYDEILECLKEVPGAQFRIHGVPKGLRDRFWKWSTGQDPDLPWTVHRKRAMERPTWNDFERRRKIALYDSRMNPNFKRNIYGEHGDASSPLFVLARLMMCVDQDSSSDYNSSVYVRLSITDEDIRNVRGDLLELTPEERAKDTSWIDSLVDDRLPRNHLSGFTAYWGGADIGVTNHPSEVLIFGMEKGKKGIVRLLCRLHLERVAEADQAMLIKWLKGHYDSAVDGKLVGFGQDRAGVGFGVWQGISDCVIEDGLLVEHRKDSWVHGWDFSEKIVVALDDAEDKSTEENLVYRFMIDYSSEELRRLVDTRSLMLPNDGDLINQFQGQTYSGVKGKDVDPNRPKRAYSKGTFHALDAAKYFAATKSLPTLHRTIRAAMKTKPARPAVAFPGMLR